MGRRSNGNSDSDNASSTNTSSEETYPYSDPAKNKEVNDREYAKVMNHVMEKGGFTRR